MTVLVEDACVFPLSYAQERLWFIDQLNPGIAAYNISEVVEFSLPLDATALAHSLNEIVRRHEVLRTTFGALQGEPFQIIAPPTPVPLPLRDLSQFTGAEQEAEAARLTQEEAHTPFDLSCGPLLRAKLLRLNDTRYQLVLTMHHIISDGWSMEVLRRELSLLYEAFAAGRPSPLADRFRKGE